MIAFDDYLDLLEQRRQILDFFNSEARAIAENSKYLRNKRIEKLQQKDSEKARKSALSVYYSMYNKKLKEKGLKVSATKSNEKSSNPIVNIVKKLFKIKPKEIPGEVEQLPEKTIEEVPEQPDIETTGIEIEDEEIEDVGGPEYTEEELDELYPDDKIPGQMDIEELNNGDVYEKD